MSQEEFNLGEELKLAFDNILEKEFGGHIPPEPIITPLGIPQLDAILGGGIGSSQPIMFTSAPETGKTSISMFIASRFLSYHKNSIVVYIDAEGACSGFDENRSLKSRMNELGIPSHRFQYIPMLLEISELYQLFKKYSDVKSDLEKKRKEEIQLLIIVDSLAALTTSKTLTAEDPNQMLGLRSRELQHTFERIKPIMAFGKITSIFIDQVRSHIKLDSGPFVKKDEKGVGIWSNVKSSTGSSAITHNIKQWCFFSKGQELTPLSDHVDGWIVNVIMEKNKLATSKVAVPIVFDKFKTVLPLRSAFLFLSEQTPTEKSYTKGDKTKNSYPLCVRSVGPYYCVDFYDPTTRELIKTSDKFFNKNLESKYETDKEFKEFFDMVLKTSVEERLNKFLLKNFIEETE